MKIIMTILATVVAFNLFAQGLMAPMLEGCTSTATQITWDWSTVESATGYMWNTVDDSVTAVAIGNVTTRTDTNLACNTPYTRYVWAYNLCGISPSLRMVCVTSSETTPAPTEGSHTSAQYSITWRWNTAAGATGYKWATTNNYSLAVDKGSSLSHNEVALNCNSAQMSYVWAYDDCGVSSVTTLTATTGACEVAIPDCANFTETHSTGGGVAPENKTITYKVVTGVSGTPSLCWLAQNLGASTQPSAANDTTNAAAGWYFQFNRKQGYKYTSSLSPGGFWEAGISESSDWTPANDPCALELGGDWRLPTRTEVEATATALHLTTPAAGYSSPLKLHSGGYIYGSERYSLGSLGAYWAASQTPILNYSYILFTNGGISVTDKALGATVRCVK